MSNPLSCIVCKRELESAIGPEARNQPYAGTCFATRGHYGSTYFDPMDGSYLEINVCDPCLEASESAGLVLRCPRRETKEKEVLNVSEPKYPNVRVQLTGQDGNAFFILGKVMKALRRAGVVEDDVNLFETEATSGDYNDLLATVMRWVNVT